MKQIRLGVGPARFGHRDAIDKDLVEADANGECIWRLVDRTAIQRPTRDPIGAADGDGFIVVSLIGDGKGCGSGARWRYFFMIRAAANENGVARLGQAGGVLDGLKRRGKRAAVV